MGEQPRPKSPPGYVDLYGKRRQQAKLQILEREIGFLQEELKSLENVQPTSRSCKELNEFLAAKQDPLIAVNQKSPETDCSWMRCRLKSCFKSSWVCCFSGCCHSDNAHHQQVKSSRHCCCSSTEYCQPCYGCGSKNFSCFHSNNCCSFKLSCSRNWCKLKLCPNCVTGCCSCYS